MSPALAAGLQIAFVLVVLAIAYVPVGDYMARVYSSTRDLRVESVIYRVGRIDSRAEQTWYGYAASVLGFSLASALFLYFLQLIQGVLPLSDGLSGVSPAVAFNTAISFVANTNW
ncbi:MAG: K+-transporting ATPase ATPase A chain, partial [Rhodococcus sp. (in: high G+C Gram-positive bacteria)]